MADADRSVTDVKEAGRDTLPRVDVIVGGFPCQGLSVAGGRKGLDDERSGLWFEFQRVLSELRPRVAVLENTPNVVVDTLTSSQVDWSKQGTIVNGKYYPQTTWVPHTCESAGSVSPIFPTPTATRFFSNQGGKAGRVGRVRLTLYGMARANEWPDQHQEPSGGALNPTWVEWLMG